MTFEQASKRCLLAFDSTIKANLSVWNAAWLSRPIRSGSYRAGAGQRIDKDDPISKNRVQWLG